MIQAPLEKLRTYVGPLDGLSGPVSRTSCRLVGRIATGRLMGILLALLLGAVFSFLLFSAVNLLFSGWVSRSLAFEGPSNNLEVVYPQKAPSEINESFYIRPSAALLESGQTPLSEVPFYEPDRPSQISDSDKDEADDKAGEGPGHAEVVIEEVRTFYVILQQPKVVTLFIVELRREQLSDASRIVLDVAFYKTPGDKTSLSRVRWWQIGNVAPSNELARIDTSLPFLKPSFPTSATAFTSWFKEHWPSLLASVNRGSASADNKPKLSAKTYREYVSPELESLLNMEVGDLEKRKPILAGRIISGWIQLITLAVFFSAIIVIACRWYVFVKVERAQIAHFLVSDDISLDPPLQPTLIGRIRWADCQFAEKWFGDKLTGAGMTGNVQGSRSAVWSIVEDAVRTAQTEPQALQQNLAIASDREEGHRATDRFFLSFLVGAIPAIGFIGTVIGIGLALGGTGAVLSDELARQQSGVSTVALALGLAFDTTLVALVLSIIVLLIKSLLTAQEELVIHHARAECRTLLSHAKANRVPVADDADEEHAAPVAQAPQRPGIDRAEPAPVNPRAGSAYHETGRSLAWSDNEVESSDPISVPSFLPSILIRSVVFVIIVVCLLYFFGWDVR